MSGLMLEVGQGLQYIHSQKIVHRDIACRNILVDARQPGELTKFLYDLTRRDRPRDPQSDTLQHIKSSGGQ